jgi:hypothetical protein
LGDQHLRDVVLEQSREHLRVKRAEGLKPSLPIPNAIADQEYGWGWKLSAHGGYSGDGRRFPLWKPHPLIPRWGPNHAEWVAVERASVSSRRPPPYLDRPFRMHPFWRESGTTQALDFRASTSLSSRRIVLIASGSWCRSR